MTKKVFTFSSCKPLLKPVFGQYACKAFTLAEVLITIGIIGIVAAMTIPTFIQNYKKKVVATRLEHFASIWRQAVKLSKFENGDSFTPIGDMTPENNVEFYKKYFMPYIKTIDIEQSNCGVIASFPNGSGIYMYGRPASDTTPPYIIFCPHSNDCKAIDSVLTNCNRPNDNSNITDGIKTFAFYTSGTTPLYAVNGSRDNALNYCKTKPGYCTTLIEMDGWVIKDDYPRKF